MVKMRNRLSLSFSSTSPGQGNALSYNRYLGEKENDEERSRREEDQSASKNNTSTSIFRCSCNASAIEKEFSILREVTSDALRQSWVDVDTLKREASTKMVNIEKMQKVVDDLDKEQASVSARIQRTETEIEHQKAPKRLISFANAGRTLKRLSVGSLSTLSLKRTAQSQLTLNRPSHPDTSLRRTSHSQLTLNRPSHPNASLRRTAQSQLTLNRPSHPNASLQRPSHSQLTLNRQSRPNTSLRRTAQSQLSLNRPSHPNASLQRTAQSQLTLNRQSRPNKSLRRISHSQLTMNRTSHSNASLNRPSSQLNLNRPSGPNASLNRPSLSENHSPPPLDPSTCEESNTNAEWPAFVPVTNEKDDASNVSFSYANEKKTEEKQWLPSEAEISELKMKIRQREETITCLESTIFENTEIIQNLQSKILSWKACKI